MSGIHITMRKIVEVARLTAWITNEIICNLDHGLKYRPFYNQTHVHDMNNGLFVCDSDQHPNNIDLNTIKYSMRHHIEQAMISLQGMAK